MIKFNQFFNNKTFLQQCQMIFKDICGINGFSMNINGIHGINGFLRNINGIHGINGFLRNINGIHGNSLELIKLGEKFMTKKLYQQIKIKTKTKTKIKIKLSLIGLIEFFMRLMQKVLVTFVKWIWYI